MTNLRPCLWAFHLEESHIKAIVCGKQHHHTIEYKTIGCDIPDTAQHCLYHLLLTLSMRVRSCQLYTYSRTLASVAMEYGYSGAVWYDTV